MTIKPIRCRKCNSFKVDIDDRMNNLRKSILWGGVFIVSLISLISGIKMLIVFGVVFGLLSFAFFYVYFRRVFVKKVYYKCRDCNYKWKGIQ